MNFLEAQSILETLKPEKELEILLVLSGTPDPMFHFLKAAFAKERVDVRIETLPFNTLQQFIIQNEKPERQKIIILFPWDLLPELDWRSGLSNGAQEIWELRQSAQTLLEAIGRVENASIFYCPSDFPPLLVNTQLQDSLHHWLLSEAQTRGAIILESSLFSLENYLFSGCPFSGKDLGRIALFIADRYQNPIGFEPKKVLVTDFDGVLWSGVIGEDGVEGIAFRPEAGGYPHFLYQQLLKKIKSEGVLVAGVTRNDEHLAMSPFKNSEMTLQLDDFVKILASYNAKSAQIKLLADELNLGLNSFVFVDDNIIELEEVSAQLPGVECIQFPTSTDQLPNFLKTVYSQFSKSVVTEEDKSRTSLYRQRLEGLAPSDLKGSNLDDFLRNLKMKMTIYDRTQGIQERCIQLINKTNQFNLNGIRYSEPEIKGILNAGGKLYSATLEDRTGTHGEVIVILVDQTNTVRSFVMSCRIFQRRAEFAFLIRLLEKVPINSFEFKPSERNKPFQDFLQETSFLKDGDITVFDSDEFLRLHGSDLDIFQSIEKID